MTDEFGKRRDEKGAKFPSNWRDLAFLDRPAVERFAELFADETDMPLPPVLGGRYRIDRELGRGGMARVYLAHDTTHERDVAVKVIRPDIAASLGRDRFLREIAIAARLRHPNIVPLYDSGDADGVLYFVMPYEEGQSLRARIAKGLPVTGTERVGLLRDVARALAYAHERGIVHRDVKPDNVMLSGGAAVVTDFGIAKAVSLALGENAGSPGTLPGGAVGTPAYMAPEQAVGDPSTDHRADIYSFGCLAYELFAGNPPFHNMSVHETIAAHIGKPPVPVSEVSADVPEHIAGLIGRCLEKKPDARPQSARELLDTLDTDAGAPPNEKRGRTGVSVRYTVIAFLLVALAGATYLISRNGQPAPAVGGLTVAVLPLQSMGGDSIQRELTYGLSDEIATALFRMPGVRVMSRRGSNNYLGQDIDPRTVGRELGASFLVTGSLREVDGTVRVIANLIDASDGTVVWSDQFDRTRAELEIVREDIASAVGSSLWRRQGGKAGQFTSVATVRTSHPEAYRLYVLGQRSLTRRGLNIQAATEMFRGAARIDSMYADAYSGLSLALALTPFFQPVPARTVARDVTLAARRALNLDSTLAQPHVALGLVHQHAFEWDRASAEFEIALRLRRPDDVEPLVQYGRHLLFRGRSKEGLRQFLAARRTEPASAVVSSWVSYAYYLGGQMDSALVESDRAYQSDSMNITTLMLGSLVRLKAGRNRQARDFVNRGRPSSPEGFYVLGSLGDTTTLMQRLAQLQRETPPRWMAHTARSYAMLGMRDTARALESLELATDADEIWPSLQSVRDPLFDSIRGSARFERLLQRVGLSAKTR